MRSIKAARNEAIAGDVDKGQGYCTTDLAEKSDARFYWRESCRLIRLPTELESAFESAFESVFE